MSDGITISIIRDEATPVLVAIQTDVQAGTLTHAMGDALVELTRDHLFALNAERHRYGRNYYAQAARSTTATTTPEEVRLGVTQLGIRQRYYGGYIRPKNKQWIAVPARQEAVAARPEEFNDLHFVLFRADLAALVQNHQTLLDGRYKRKGSITPNAGGTRGDELGGGVFWWLKKEVYQQPDETVLPPTALIVSTALDAATRRAARITQRDTADS